MKFLLSFFLLLPFIGYAQIEYHDSNSNPADNGSLNNATPAVTPPADMEDGDLILLIGQRRVSNITFTISATGGQDWNALPALTGTANVSARIFWCRFNGTWTANPSISMSGTGGNTITMHVFRPPSRGYAWKLDVDQVQTGSAAAATITRTGVTTDNANTVTLASWFTADDNSWGNLNDISGTGWAVTGNAQYRNRQGTDQSATFAHLIRTTSGATGNVSKQQTANGNDATRTAIVSFYCYRTNMPLFMF
ncbi:hypothetical protein [Sediminibacterium sp.]|uniref:hypothetical protein n=1 Tax=Sediminibacterium sp. TaxID=1917865 RepID=UPI0025CB83F2|nr:hypothetical protein [Sediminibacterium sp.]MBW0179435.1 hypothetical protein [Sediminibacterium sp.]